MHYGVIGMGPVGSTLAALLAQSGQEVSVLCLKEDQKELLLQRDIRVTRGAGADAREKESSDKLLAAARVTSAHTDPARFLGGKPQVILIATKSCDSPQLIETLKRHDPDPGTLFVSCQNGLDVENQIIDAWGSGHALRMVIHIGCHFTGEQEVHISFMGRHILSLRPEVDPVLTRTIFDHLNAAGWPIELSAEYRTEVFKKATLNSVLGNICAISQSTLKEITNDPGLLALSIDAARECIRIAKREGIEIPLSYFLQAVDGMKKTGDHYPSIVTDVQKGRKTENEFLCGRFLELARKHGLTTPLIEALYSLVRFTEMRGLKRGELNPDDAAGIKK